MTCTDLVAYAAKTAVPRSNEHEFALCKLVKDAGQIPVAIGWPDLAIFAMDGTLKALVEVKPNTERGLKAQQELMLRGLAALNVPCFRWSPDGDFFKIHADGTTGTASMNCPTSTP